MAAGEEARVATGEEARVATGEEARVAEAVREGCTYDLFGEGRTAEAVTAWAAGARAVVGVVTVLGAWAGRSLCGGDLEET